MDKIWYRNPSKSEVIGGCGGDEKPRMTTQNRQKSNAKKSIRNQILLAYNCFKYVLLKLVPHSEQRINTEYMYCELGLSSSPY